MEIQLTEIQIKNLLTFLDRVSITGLTEVGVFNEIVNILIQAIQPVQKNI